MNYPVPVSFVGPEGAMKMEAAEMTLEEQIGNMLDLIVFTPRGAVHGDPDFGFEYWNHEFSNINIREFNNSYAGLLNDTGSINDISRQACEHSLRSSIAAYEPRLIQPDVRITLESNVSMHSISKMSKYEMHIVITGGISEGMGITRPYEKKISFMVEPIANKRHFS